MNIAPLIQEYKNLNLHDVINYDRFNEFAVTHHSTAIEGSTLSLQDVQLLINDGLTPAGKPFIHALMVKNHFDAIRFVMDLPNDTVINIPLIQKMNALVMKDTGVTYNTALGTVNSSEGEFRKGNVTAGDSYFPNYDKVPQLMNRLVENLEKELIVANTVNEKVELSFKAHFDLVSIHPFYDGNGRTSRLLMNLIQKRFGLPLAIVFIEDKKEYINALVASRKNENLRPFFNFMYSQYAKFLNAEIEKYKSEIQDKNKDLRGGFSLVF